MTLSSALEARVAALVHPSATAIGAQTAHRAFLSRMLVAGGLASAMLPVDLLEMASAPSASLFALGLLAPSVALLVAARTGRLRLAQAIAIGGFAAVATLPIVLGWAGGGGALVWLAALLFEVKAARFSRFALLVVALGGAGLVATSALAPEAAANALFAAPALACVAFFALNAKRDQPSEIVRSPATATDILADVAGDLVLRVDRSGLVQAIGGSDAHRFGVPQAELIERGFFDRLHVVDRPAFLKAVSDAAQGGTTHVVSLRLRGTDRSRAGGPDVPTFRWIELRLRRDDAAPAMSMVAVGRDVTDLKTHEEALEAARITAEGASRAKDNFLANVSHELRTPLNAIIGFSEMMCSAQVGPVSPEKGREYAEIIHESGHHLLAVVNSLLDMSKIQAGSFEIHPEPFAVAPLVDLCCDMVKLRAEGGGVALVRAYLDGVDEIVADKRACKQIVLNLLSNAVKFTPRGGRVTIGVRPDGNYLLMQVADTGIGIDPRDLGRLGDAFFQARTGVDRPFEGTGLGLSVTRGLVGLHGGTIAVESEPGRGTAVTVRLPLDSAGRSTARGSATIETLPRRSRVDDLGFSKNMKVRNVA